MYQCYLVCVDGNNGYEEWFCDVAEENDGTAMTENEMLNDVQQCLEELGGGHADIFNADIDELFEEIEVQLTQVNSTWREVWRFYEFVHNCRNYDIMYLLRERSLNVY